MKSHFRYLFSIVLSLILILSSILPIHATEVVKFDNTEFSVTQLSNQDFVVQTNEEKALVRFEKNGDITTSYYKDLLSNKSFYITRNEVTNEVYLSTTGETILVESPTHNTEKTIVPFAKVGPDIFVETIFIPASRIAGWMEDLGSVIAIGVAILTSYGFIAIVSNDLAELLGMALTLGGKLFTDRYTGLKIDKYKHKRSSTKNGKVYVYWDYTHKNVRLIKR